MAVSPSEAVVTSPSSAADPGPVLPPGPPGEDARGPGRGWLPAAAVALAVLGVAAFVAPVVGVRHDRVFSAAGAVVVLLLAGVFFALRRQRDAAVADAASWEDRVRQAQQGAAEQQRRAVLWEQRAAQAQQRAEDQGRRQEDRFRSMMTGLAEAADHLIHVLLPAALEGSAAPSAPLAAGAGNDAAALFAAVADAVAKGAAGLREQVDELRQRSDDQSESSRRAVLTLARLLQASALRIQGQAAKMAEERPADPGVLEASMRVEHAAAQMARNAQSLVVLCGEWPGQQWPDPLALPDVVRAAAGRIMSYQRVNVSGDHGVAADAGVVEPLIHLVAELLANATQSSPPATQVEVTVQAVQHGAVVEIDDRGIGMEEAQFSQAREILSGARLVGLGDLGEFPQTGLPVIGHYVSRHGFGVELRKSPYGGVRAVVLVPDPLVVSNLEPAGGRPAPPPAPPAPPAPAPGAPGPGGASQARHLPHRQSLRGQAPAQGDTAQRPDGRPADPDPGATPEQEGAFLAAYLSAGETAAAGGAAGETEEDDAAFSDETEQ